MNDAPGPSGENKRTDSDVEEELLVSSGSDIEALASSSDESKDPSEQSESSDSDVGVPQNDGESDKFGYIGVVGAADLQLARRHISETGLTPEPRTPSRGDSPISSSDSTHSHRRRDKMSDVIEICSSDDESDPVAKINKKLRQLKSLTIRDVGKGMRKNQENIMTKGNNIRRKAAKMPMILNTMSLASTNNIQTNQSLNGSAKKRPTNIPPGITVKSLPKNKPSPRKGIVRNNAPRTKNPTFLGGPRRAIIPNDVIQMLNARTQNSISNKPSMQNAKIRQIPPVPKVGNGVTITKVTDKAKMNQCGVMPQDAMISIPNQKPGTKRKTQEAANLPTPKRKNSTDSLMTKLKNNKNIVLTSSVPTATDKENKLVRSSELVDFVNIDDSDDESKENDTITADSPMTVEILDLDYEPSNDRSIFPKETPLKKNRRRKRPVRIINQNENSRNSYVSASSDMEMLEDNVIVESSFSLTSGMSEGECIGIDDNDIQIVENDSADGRIGTTINIASAIRTFNGTPVIRSGSESANLDKSSERNNVSTRDCTPINRKITPKLDISVENRREHMPVKRKSNSRFRPDRPQRTSKDTTLTIQNDTPEPKESLKRMKPQRVEEPMAVDPDIFDVRSNSPKALEIDMKPEMKPPIEMKPPVIEEYKFSALYQRFIDLCFDLDDSEDMVKIVDKKVKSYYKMVDVHFVTSTPFEKLLIENMNSMRETPAHKHLYIKNVVDELKAKRNKRGAKPSVIDLDSDEKVPSKRWVSDKHLEKLEKALSKLQKAIKMLEEKEVNFDEEDDSVYMMTEKYKARAVRVFEKLCSLRGIRAAQQNPAATVLRRGELGTGPGIAALTTWLIKGGYYAFPDYRDVVGCIKTDLTRQKLIWTEAKIEEEAQKIFLNCGRVLQGARKATEWAGAVSVIAGKPDPATEDLDLREKLNHNSALYKKKEEEIINKFVEQQAVLRLEPEPVGDDGLIVSTAEPLTVDGTMTVDVEMSTSVRVEIDVPVETTVVSTEHLPVEVACDDGAIPSTSTASDGDLLRVASYDYIPFSLAS